MGLNHPHKMNTQINKLTINDYESIIHIWQRAGLPYKPGGRDSRKMMTTEMSHDYCAYFGLFDSNTMIGLGIANFDGRRGWINRVAIDPEFRGQGLAGLLIEALESFLRELGAVVICALIEEINTPSMDCFEKAGFTCEPTFRYFTKRDSADS